MNENVQIAFVLTIVAGLSTGIGSAIAFFIKERSVKILTFTMGLAAGVMIYLSFMELLPHAMAALEQETAGGGHNHYGKWLGILAFFIGMLVVGVIDTYIPHHHHEVEGTNPTDYQKDKKLMRVGVMTAVALAIHNLPEGLATFVSALEDPNLGMGIAFAIALHNIPEGIAVSMPIYHATGDRKKAFMYSFLSGIVEPIGAILGYFIFMPFLTPVVLGFLLSSVAGVMVFISLDQLLPTAQEHGDRRMSIYGVVLGMMMMAVSLALLVGHHHH